MEIKPGDLVAVVKSGKCPRLNTASNFKLGSIFVAGEYYIGSYLCHTCGLTHFHNEACVWIPGEHVVINISRLKKIDPPSEGDSLPTRADLKLEA